MVTGGIAATAAVGTVAASQPTVTATSTDCGVIDLEYTDHGPTVSVSLAGPEETYHVALEPAGSDQVEVLPGSYDVSAKPASANGGSSLPVDRTPVDVAPCNVPSVEVTMGYCLDEMVAGIDIYNPLDECVPVEVVHGSGIRNDLFSIDPGDTVEDIGLDLKQYDEWAISAYSPTTAGDCSDTSGSTIHINDEPSPLQLTGSSCSDLKEDL